MWVKSLSLSLSLSLTHPPTQVLGTVDALASSKREQHTSLSTLFAKIKESQSSATAALQSAPSTPLVNLLHSARHVCGLHRSHRATWDALPHTFSSDLPLWLPSSPPHEASWVGVAGAVGLPVALGVCVKENADLRATVSWQVDGEGPAVDPTYV